MPGPTETEADTRANRIDPVRRPRILFLADRNIVADRALTRSMCLRPMRCAASTRTRSASKAERARSARAHGLAGYEREIRAFLDYVLDAYEKHGVEELASRKIADFLRIRYGGTNDAKRLLGPVPAIRNTFVAIQGHLYR
jgi:hypothetical protein